MSLPGAANAACTVINLPDSHTSPATSPMASGGTITVTLGALCDSFGLNPYPDTIPPNLSTNPQHGTVSMVNSSAGQFTYTNNGDGATSDTWVMTDASDHTFTLTVTIGAATSPITVSPASLPTPNVGTPYSQTLSAGGGTAPYGFVLTSGSLPSGLSFAGTTISGTPNQAGSYAVTFTVTDSASVTGTKSYSMSVPNPSSGIALASPPNAFLNAPYNYTLSASGALAPYTFSKQSGTLPTGLALAGNGAITGTPTASGTFNFDVVVTDSSPNLHGSSPGPYFKVISTSITVLNVPPTVGATSATVAYGSANNPITLNITGAPATSVAVASAASHGTATASGTSIKYTPNTGYAGPDSFTYTASNGAGTSSPAGTVTITVSPPTITYSPSNPPAGTVGIAYSQSIAAGASGGAAPYTYSYVSGTLPPSLNLASNGTLSGTPSTGGTFTFMAKATDNSTGTGPFSSAPASVTVTINVPPPTIASIAPNTGPTAGGTTVVLTGTNLSNATAVKFGTTNATGYAINGPTQITATSPAASAGTVDITVTTAGGTSVTSTADRYTYVTAPTAANKSGVAVPYNSSGTAIDLSASITGVHNSIAIGTAPAHGTTSIAGDVVTYTPMSGYFGTDSFTYTATGPGGTSSPATVSLTVATPPAPTVADKSGMAVPYNSSGTAIDLSASITGVHNSIAIGTPAAHGTTSIAGDVVTYTPTSGYFGTDSFTYTATGPGGTSSPATVSLTVATPPAPIAADKSGVAVPYNSSGTAIDLSASITGVHNSIAIGTAPAHGTTSIAGDVVTYTPTSGYFGTDSFTYTATGPGGTSSLATVSLTVATPPAPTAADKNGVAVPYNSGGTAIDLSASIIGVHNSIAIGTAPAHGTTSIAGDVVTYTPTSGYFGADSFTYTATGPGGTSSPATVSLTVATPPAPIAADKSGVAVPYNSSGTAIDLSTSITGVHNSIAIGTASAHGTTSIAGDVVTYTPTSGYFGADSFTYTATGPGGTSSLATVSLTVATPAAPTAADKSGVAVPYNSSGTAIDLSASITGVHNSIAIGTASAHGTTSIAGDVVTYTPTSGYFGADSFTYTATGPGGTSSPATVNLTVATPPAPTVTGLSPSSGPTAGGTSVIITGTGFTGTTAVTFGGTAATGVTVVGDATITATTPAHAAGAVTVAVTASGGSTGMPNGFTYVAPQAATTTTTLSLAPNPVTANQAVTATVTVSVALSGPTGFAPSAATNAPTAASSVTVSGGGQSCTAAVGGSVTSLSGSCALAFATPGSYTITASYAGDASTAPSSATQSLTVVAAATTATASAPALSFWMLALLGAMLAALGLRYGRRHVGP